MSRPTDTFVRDFIDVDGVVRPRHNSENAAICESDAGLREFWRWFQDSAVVDGQGRPLVQYHGTTAVFETFRTNNELGAHFGTRAQAQARTEGAAGAALLPVYLTMTSPLRLQDLGFFTGYEVVPQLEEAGIVPEDCDFASDDALKQYLQTAGYDGVVYLNRREGAHDPFAVVDECSLEVMTDDEVKAQLPWTADSWIAFEPTQIMFTAAALRLSPTEASSVPRRALKMR